MYQSRADKAAFLDFWQEIRHYHADTKIEHLSKIFIILIVFHAQTQKIRETQSFPDSFDSF